MPEIIAAWLSGLSLGLLLVAFWMIAKTSASVARVERKLDALLKHSGVDLSTLDRPESGQRR